MRRLTICITGATGLVGRACLNSDLGTNHTLIPCSRNLRNGFYHVDTLVDVPSGDVLLHLGEDSNIARVNSTSWPDVESSYIDFCKLVEMNDFENVIYLSSSAVEKPSTANESGNAGDPQNYVRLKLMMEDKVMSLGGSVIRVPNLYGTSLVPGTILYDLYNNVVMGGQYSLRNPNALIRFLHLDDLVDLLKLIVNGDNVGMLSLSGGSYYAASNVAEFFGYCLQSCGIKVIDKTSPFLQPKFILEQKKNSLQWSETRSLKSGIIELVRRVCDN